MKIESGDILPKFVVKPFDLSIEDIRQNKNRLEVESENSIIFMNYTCWIEPIGLSFLCYP